MTPSAAVATYQHKAEPREGKPRGGETQEGPGVARAAGYDSAASLPYPSMSEPLQRAELVEASLRQDGAQRALDSAKILAEASESLARDIDVLQAAAGKLSGR